MNRLKAAWRAFRHPDAEYWRGFRAAREPMLHVLARMIRKHEWRISLSLDVLHFALFPKGEPSLRSLLEDRDG